MRSKTLPLPDISPCPEFPPLPLPEQQTLAQRCLPQCFLRPHFLAQRNCPEASPRAWWHGATRDVSPHAHLCVTFSSQAGQLPKWHLALHLCCPQGSNFSQICPQTGTGSTQLVLPPHFSISLSPSPLAVKYSNGVLPHGQRVTREGDSWHSPHGPAWQGCSQAW